MPSRLNSPAPLDTPRGSPKPECEARGRYCSICGEKGGNPEPWSSPHHQGTVRLRVWILGRKGAVHGDFHFWPLQVSKPSLHLIAKAGLPFPKQRTLRPSSESPDICLWWAQYSGHLLLHNQPLPNLGASNNQLLNSQTV